MIQGRHFIAGEWVEGAGGVFTSENPADGSQLWQGGGPSAMQVDAAVSAARTAQPEWSATELAARMQILRRFCQLVAAEESALAQLISRETGKPLWEAQTEVKAVQAKIDISYRAYRERSGEQTRQSGGVRSRLSHRPQGVVAVLGPYNFPAHLPNGHIVPALIAGNTLIFKPSEYSPAVGASMVELWQRAGVPAGVVNLLQGGVDCGAQLAAHPGLDGLFFTGSSNTGRQIHALFAGDTRRILALEMGGNNPLLVWQAADIEAAAYHCVQSAFLSAGQRCTCARRLILAEGPEGDRQLRRLLEMMNSLRVGHPEERPEPFMGPVINNATADRLLQSQQRLIDMGAKPLQPMARLWPDRPFLAPGLIDCSAVSQAPDEEYFGPLLQCYRVKDLEQAIACANRTRFGLAAGLLSDSEAVYRQFYRESRAGIINWNRPLTGASSEAPFGGSGASGNHRPGAYYAADYCAYPVASLESESLELPAVLVPGIKL